MAYVVKKPLNIGGRRRAIGEILRNDEVASAAAMRSGYIARIDSKLVEVAENAGGLSEGGLYHGKVNLPVIAESGSTVISAAPESISEAVRIMQLPQADAIEAVRHADDEDMLTIVKLCEGNKTILAAVRKQMAELNTRVSGGGGSAGDA